MAYQQHYKQRHSSDALLWGQTTYDVISYNIMINRRHSFAITNKHESMRGLFAQYEVMVHDMTHCNWSDIPLTTVTCTWCAMVNATCCKLVRSDVPNCYTCQCVHLFAVTLIYIARYVACPGGMEVTCWTTLSPRCKKSRPHWAVIFIRIPLPRKGLQTSYCTHVLLECVLQTGLDMGMSMNGTAQSHVTPGRALLGCRTGHGKQGTLDAV